MAVSVSTTHNNSGLYSHLTHSCTQGFLGSSMPAFGSGVAFTNLCLWGMRELCTVLLYFVKSVAWYPLWRTRPALNPQKSVCICSWVARFKAYTIPPGGRFRLLSKETIKTDCELLCKILYYILICAFIDVGSYLSTCVEVRDHQPVGFGLSFYHVGLGMLSGLVASLTTEPPVSTIQILESHVCPISQDQDTTNFFLTQNLLLRVKIGWHWSYAAL